MFSVLNLLVLPSLVIVYTQSDVSVHNPFYCYSDDPIRPRTLFGGIHSVYEISRGQTINPDVSTCNPTKFWMAGRHGAILPLANDLPNLSETVTRLQSEILLNYDQGKTSLCASDIELIRNWRFDPNITMENAEFLASSGWDEMKALAQRFQIAFPSILSSTYSPNDYFFRSTEFQRTKASLNAFADGLFGVNGHEQIRFEDIPEQDVFMRSNQHCPLYIQINAERFEQNAFREGPEYQEMTVQVSAKLGFHGSHALRNNDIAILAQICRFEQIWDLSATSPFCAAFSVANSQVIEYSEDVDLYFRFGYGRPQYRRLYENLMCFQMQDMLNFIQSNDANDHKARIFSGHVNQFLIILNFRAFDDDAPLTRHNFAQQMQRVWRSSFNMPMASNLAVIRYDCDDGDNDILFLFNEIPLQISGCGADGVCKQSLILERFSHFLNVNCMEVFCTNN
ncbi:hypothetical protein HA402_011465 [Bradysia odoriphaga]|nr:hypothetical protein HA402_011465 [Bradysia odoriphaga]